MIYTAVVGMQDFLTPGNWMITPQYTRVDGLPAPDQSALPSNGITPSSGDIVLCVESRNDHDQTPFKLFEGNGGAFPIIIATYGQLLTLTLDFVLSGKMTLGLGTDKMVLGDALATYCQGVDAVLAALDAWGKTCKPPFPGISTISLYSAWASSNLSSNHKLD